MHLIFHFASGIPLASSFSQFLLQALRQCLHLIFHMAMMCTSQVCLERGVCILAQRILLQVGVDLIVWRRRKWRSLRSARDTQLPFRIRCRLLAWMQASWRARIWSLSCLLSGNGVPSLVDRIVVVMCYREISGGWKNCHGSVAIRGVL